MGLEKDNSKRTLKRTLGTRGLGNTMRETNVSHAWIWCLATNVEGAQLLCPLLKSSFVDLFGFRFSKFGKENGNLCLTFRYFAQLFNCTIYF